MDFKWLNRRMFTRGLCSSSSYFLLPLLARIAQAQTDDGKNFTRFVGIFSGNGTSMSHWRPQGNGQVNSLRLSDSLTPLAAYRDRMTVLQGVDNKTRGPGNNHIRGIMCALTAAPNNTGNDIQDRGSGALGYNSGESLDQFIARNLDSRSALLGVHTKPDHLTLISSKGDRRPVYPESNPYLVRDNFFPGASAPARDSSASDINKSIFDSTIADLRALKSNSSSFVAKQLDDHTTAIRELERNMLAAVGNTCSAPALDRMNYAQNGMYPKTMDLQMINLAQILSCGLAKSSLLLLSRGVSIVTHSWLNQNRAHHSYSHESSAGSLAAMSAVTNWQAGKIKSFLDMLDGIPEGNGTMLDNTVVLWFNELAEGDRHRLTDLPYVLISGNKKVLPGGRFLQFNDESHGKLLLTIAKSMGIAVNSFGSGQSRGTSVLSNLMNF